MRRAPTAIRIRRLAPCATTPLTPIWLGLPALSVPCGISEAGLPFGFQLTGRAFDEAMVYRIANAYEREHDWHLRKAALLAGV